MPSETLVTAQAAWDALQGEAQRLDTELDAANATIKHMAAAMSHIAGHDRQGLDHLEDAMRADKARENAVKQARAWKGHARALERVVDEQAEELRNLRAIVRSLPPHAIRDAQAAEEVARAGRAQTLLAADAAATCAACGHSRTAHLAPPGEQCMHCPGDDERSWRHAFQVAATVNV